MSDDLEIQQFKIFSVNNPAKEHDVYLGDSVSSDSAEYIDLLKFFYETPETDVVRVHLANFGGACHAGLRIAHAIRNCKAPVVIHVDAPCYSMGAIIALAGSALFMYPGTFLMFHNYSTVEAGKGGEVRSAVGEYEKHFHYSLDYFCSPFLAAPEIKKLRNDQDVYIHAEDSNLRSRLKRHFKGVKYEFLDQ